LGATASYKGDQVAVVRSLEFEGVGGKPHPTEVDARWRVVQSSSGPLLQVSTFGSDERESEPKVSQTIQLDREVASQLAEVIRSVFGDI